MLNEVLRLTKGDLSNVIKQPIKKKAMPSEGPIKKVKLPLGKNIKNTLNKKENHHV